MRAVLRLCWTFFTAVPLQRVLGWLAVAILAAAILGRLLSGESFWLTLGSILAFVAGVFPVLFTSPALFRSLSAPRVYQLLPHFRLRMLVSVSLVLGTLLLFVGVFMFFFSTRTLPIATIGFPLAFLIGMFLVLFFAFSDWRWSLLIPLGAGALVLLQRGGPGIGILAALPAWLWSAAALGAWLVFAAWYLRVRQVRAIMLMPQPRVVVLDATQPVSHAVAIRTLLYAYFLSPRRSLFIGVVLLFVGVLVALRSLSLTSFIWPLGVMLIFAERSTAIIRQARLLWLKIPGSRDAVRSEIEQVLWRNWVGGSMVLAILAAIAASPLGNDSAARACLGLVLTAGAALYGTYLAFAGVQSLPTFISGGAVLMLLEIALLGRPTPSLAAAAAVAAAELAGAALLRVLTIRRWRMVDWLRVRPHPTLAGGPRWL